MVLSRKFAAVWTRGRACARIPVPQTASADILTGRVQHSAVGQLSVHVALQAQTFVEHKCALIVRLAHV